MTDWPPADRNPDDDIVVPPIPEPEAEGERADDPRNLDAQGPGAIEGLGSGTRQVQDQ